MVGEDSRFRLKQVEAFVKALFAIAYTFIRYDNLLNYDDRLDQG